MHGQADAVCGGKGVEAFGFLGGGEGGGEVVRREVGHFAGQHCAEDEDFSAGAEAADVRAFAGVGDAESGRATLLEVPDGGGGVVPVGVGFDDGHVLDSRRQCVADFFEVSAECPEVDSDPCAEVFRCGRGASGGGCGVHFEKQFIETV